MVDKSLRSRILFTRKEPLAWWQGKTQKRMGCLRITLLRTTRCTWRFKRAGLVRAGHCANSTTSTGDRAVCSVLCHTRAHVTRISSSARHFLSCCRHLSSHPLASMHLLARLIYLQDVVSTQHSHLSQGISIGAHVSENHKDLSFSQPG